MLSVITTRKAFMFVKHNQVKLCNDSNIPSFLHFKVDDYDVYRKIRNNEIYWSCNAVREGWGCVLNVKSDRTETFCSHTEACRIYIEKIFKNEYK